MEKVAHNTPKETTKLEEINNIFNIRNRDYYELINKLENIVNKLQIQLKDISETEIKAKEQPRELIALLEGGLSFYETNNTRFYNLLNTLESII